MATNGKRADLSMCNQMKTTYAYTSLAWHGVPSEEVNDTICYTDHSHEADHIYDETTLIETVVSGYRTRINNLLTTSEQI